MSKEIKETTMNIDIIPVKSVSEPTLDENNMTQAEKKKIIEIIKSYQPQDLQIAITTFPDDLLWSELIRRESAMFKKIKCVEEIVGIKMDNIQPIPAIAWNETKKRYDDIKDKFVKLKRMFGGVEE